LVYLTADYVQIKGIDISGFTQVNNGDMWEPLRIYGCNYCTFELLNIHHNGAGMQLTNSNQCINGDMWEPLRIYGCNYCTFELLNIHHNGAGMQLTNSNQCIVKNSDFHHNQDPLTTSAGAYGNADGMGVDGTNPNAINYVYGCRFWYNSDDGIDTWAEEGMVYIENCWTFWNGFIPDTWNVGGDGNGFKLGITAASSPTVVKRKLTNNIAFQNKKWGFLDNGLKCNAEIYNNTAYQNGYKGLDSWSGGFNFTTTTEATKYYIKNNIAYGNSDNADVGDVTNINHNTWDLSVTVNDADFVSLSTTGLDGSRQPDGSLPTTTFLHLAQGSDLIDKGVSVGLPFNGTAPDLGAYEANYGPITPTSPYYISATGNDNTGNGTIDSPWFTLNKAWSYVKAGETIYVRGGVYKYDLEQFLTNKSGTAENYIKVFAYQDEVPIINPSTSYTGNVGITVENVSYVHIKGLDVSQYTQRTSDDWYNGIIAADANYCIFEELNVHHNGFGMSLGRWTTGDPVTGNVFLNCDFHHNYDPITAITTNVPYGGSDGLTIRVDNPNSVNTVIGCRFWNNSDDGFDGWYNAGFLLFENCWSFNNGYREDGVTEGGDGNGFKMGPLVAPPWTGYETEHKRTMQNCIAFNNRVNGFDQNASLCVIHFYNCTAFGNGNHGFLMNNNSAIQMIARNNISYRNAKGSAYFTAVSTVDHNTFTYNNGVNTNYSVSDADFLSISPLGSDGPRQSNGNLPDILFLKLSNGSDLINGGVDVGLPYKGPAPDLGSFETEDTSPVIVKAIISNGYMITTQGSQVTTNK